MKMNLATKDIRHNLGRFSLTTIGIGLLLMVVMGMGGIYRGIVEDATLLIDRVGTDLWVVQRNTRGPFAEVSRLPPNVVHRVTSVPGVAMAREFAFHTIQREKDDRLLRIAVFGLGWPIDKGQWIPLTQGRPLAQSRFEMIANDSLGLPLGSHIQLGKETYTVVGLTKNMISSNGDGIAFVAVQDALAIQFDMSGEGIRLERSSRQVRGSQFEPTRQQPSLLENARRPTLQLPAIPRPQLSAVMVRLAPGEDAERVAGIIRGWGDVSVFTREGQRELLLKGMVDKVRRQIGLFRTLLTAIAGIIMALVLYTLTLDKVHSIALLKLIGAPNSVILGLILQQSLLLGVLGFGIAFFVGQQVFPLFPRRVVITEPDLLQLAAVVLGISVVSSILGIWKALSVSPNEALS